ncbi:MAG TPA: hypothetical protein VF101_04735 [Gaiellaceae bacterium]
MKRLALLLLCAAAAAAITGSVVGANVGKSSHSGRAAAALPARSAAAPAARRVARAAALTETESSQVVSSGVVGVSTAGVSNGNRLLLGHRPPGQKCIALSLAGGSIVTAFDCTTRAVKAWSFSLEAGNDASATSDLVAVPSFAVRSASIRLRGGSSVAASVVHGVAATVVTASVPSGAAVSLTGADGAGNAFDEPLTFGFATD